MLNFIEHLMRGGSFGHYWSKQSSTTKWWAANQIPDLQDSEEDIYFGVHPSRVQKDPRSRTLIDDIEAINCLYADFDSKDFPTGKSGAASHIKTLHTLPSVIVDSGGGYHCYWLLSEPFILDSSFKRQIAKTLHEDWVHLVGGDSAVHDLARVLRLPGTLNYKYDPPREVRVLHANLDRRYTIDELSSLVNEHRGDEDDTELETPKTPRPNRLTLQEVVTLAQASKRGAEFVRLWKGFDSSYDSPSEADLALCCMLAFWTGGDYEKIDQLFRLSSRMRDKWEREDYRHTTLLKALGQVSEYYTDPGDYLGAAASDEGNAQCVFVRCKDQFLFCPAYGYMHYTGTHWSADTADAQVELFVLRILKERRVAAMAAGEEVDEKKREAILRASKGSAGNVRNCMTLLKALLTVSINTFDESIDELNCPNGVLDLRTGVLTEHSPHKRFTYCLGARYVPEADQKVWAGWLLDTVGGVQEVVDFLQLAVGYSLTGHTREEMLFYIYGPARAGKGVFTETLQALLGGRPLATEVGMELFLDEGGDSSQGFGLAGLKAARFVAASESKENQWLNSAKLKRWTGGSPITCAHKYQRAFTYSPQFKIWMTSNYPPRMDPDDEAGWTRPRVIKFPNSHVGRENKLLKGMMQKPSVLEGILAWAVEGAIKWYKTAGKGLRAPLAIVKETERARDELDWVARWVSEDIIITGRDEDRISSKVYWNRYKDWSVDNGAPVKKQSNLTIALRRAGYEVSHTARVNGKLTRCWKGVVFQGSTYRESLERIGQQEQAALECKENCEV